MAVAVALLCKDVHDAKRRWVRLYVSTNWRENGRLRRAMLKARRQYQDAQMEWASQRWETLLLDGSFQADADAALSITLSPVAIEEQLHAAFHGKDL